jgi:protein kinase C substrate 80K-H
LSDSLSLSIWPFLGYLLLVRQWYTGGDTFLCLDRSKRIPYSAVNDDYCDCEDGSDEPGTSACPNMVFYCENQGHIPRVILSGWVDDSVCDCCDGSDEFLGRVSCPNTCQQEHEIYQQKLDEDTRIYNEGANIRQALLSEAKSNLQQKRLALREFKTNLHRTASFIKMMEGRLELMLVRSLVYVIHQIG